MILDFLFQSNSVSKSNLDGFGNEETFKSREEAQQDSGWTRFLIQTYALATRSAHRWEALGGGCGGKTSLAIWEMFVSSAGSVPNFHAMTRKRLDAPM